MSEVTGDPVLAKYMRDAGVKAPVERIIGTDFLITAFNRGRLGHDMIKRVVDLECGHKTITKNRRRAPCEICHEMILNGEDYHAFRFLNNIE